MKTLFNRILVWIINLILNPNKLGYWSENIGGDFVVINEKDGKLASFYDRNNWQTIESHFPSTDNTFIETIDKIEWKDFGSVLKRTFGFQKEILIFIGGLTVAIMFISYIAHLIFQPSTLVTIGLWSLGIFAIAHLGSLILGIYANKNKKVAFADGCLIVIAGYTNIITGIALGFENWIIAASIVGIIAVVVFDYRIGKKRQKSVGEITTDDETISKIKPLHVAKFIVLVYPITILVRALPYIAYFLTK